MSRTTPTSRRLCLCTAALIALVAWPAASVADPPLVLPIQPARVALVGTLRSRVFYSAPGTGDDRREQFLVLELEESAQIAAPGGSIIDEVSEVQVASDRREQLLPFVGAKVSARGTLFIGREGRHHTRVVLHALGVEAVRE